MPNNIYAQTLETIGNQRNVFEAPQIKLNHSVYGVAINTDTNKIYLSTAKSVTVIDGKSGNVTDIHAGAFPTSFRVVYVPTFIAVNPNTNTIYVAHYGLNYIRVIDGYTNTNVTDIRVPYTPTSIAVNPNTNTIYVANSGSNYVTGIVGNNDTDLTNISAGKFPTSIAVNPNTNTIYVANSGSDSVSVINGTNDTNLTDIHLAYTPTSIAVNPNTNTIYVANQFSNNVSVINGTNDTNLTDIHLAYTPTSIAVNPNTNTIYVANSGSDFVSVINGNNNKVIGDIHVGAFPTLAVNPNAYTMYPTLAVNPNANTIYVAHYGFDRVTVIDASINKVAAGVTFDINPINSGHIVCDKIESPTNQYLYVGFGITCAAQPNKGFEFSSWNENLGHNSTRSIMTSNSTGSPLKAFLDILGIKTDDPAATFNVTQFGSFTANFKALPPPVPPEFWVPLFTIIASTDSWLVYSKYHRRYKIKVSRKKSK